MNSSRPSSLLPKIESIDGWLQDCVGYYGSSVADGPNVAPINKKYGGWDMRPSNVFFTDGEFDPWRGLSVSSLESESPDRPSTTNIPANGQSGGTTFFGYVIEGGFHCADLGNAVRQNKTSSTLINPDGSPGVDIASNANTAHTIFVNALKVWLPAFKQHSVSASPTISPADVANGGSTGAKKGAALRSGVSRTGVLCSVVLSSLLVYSVL